MKWLFLAVLFLCACNRQTPSGTAASVGNAKVQQSLPPLPTEKLPSQSQMPSMESFLAPAGPTNITLEWSNNPVSDGSFWETGLVNYLTTNDVAVLPYGTGGLVRCTISVTNNILLLRAFNRIKGTH